MEREREIRGKSLNKEKYTCKIDFSLEILCLRSIDDLSHEDQQNFARTYSSLYQYRQMF